MFVLNSSLTLVLVTRIFFLKRMVYKCTNVTLSLFGTPARTSTADMISIIPLPYEGKFGHNKKFEDAEPNGVK